jgi:hypothetical protein
MLVVVIWRVTRHLGCRLIILGHIHNLNIFEASNHDDKLFTLSEAEAIRGSIPVYK